MWDTVKLGDVCTINNGGTPKSKVSEYWDGDIQWLTPKDMGKLTSRYTSNTERHISQEGLANSSAKLIPQNSVILSCRAPIGHVAINKVPMSFNQGCKGLVPSPDLLVEYLFYFLISSKQLLNDLGTGTTFKEISGKTLATVDIPLPSLAEQQRIVAKLDAAFAEIDRAILLAEQSKKYALRFYSHTIDALFEGCTRDADTLGNLSTINYGYTAKASHEKGSYKFLRITDIQENTVNWDSVPFCEVEAKKLAKVLLQDGDIVFARTGATTGKSFLVENPKDSVFASYLIRVSVDREKLIPRYVMHYFQSASYWEQVQEGISGAAQGGFNATKLSELKIPVADKDIQHALITRLDDALENSKQLSAIYAEKAQQLSELKSAILTQELQPPQSEAA
jgi:type I restriction enzyme S subunit